MKFIILLFLISCAPKGLNYEQKVIFRQLTKEQKNKFKICFLYEGGEFDSCYKKVHEL